MVAVKQDKGWFRESRGGFLPGDAQNRFQHKVLWLLALS